jgi:catechol 2,3-dioxygenase-like lactoylglutathione lyase family enzyme
LGAVIGREEEIHMETTMNPVNASQVSSAKQPRFFGISHLSLPCRNLEESKMFYAQVMCGELVHDVPGFVEFRIEDIIIGLAEQPEGWTDPEAEYPHYAFYISGPNFELMKPWLDSYEVPNYPYRRDDTALVYFRDPSGNLLELYCDSGYDGIKSLPPAPRRGGPPIDFRSLNYQWNRVGAAENLTRPRFASFAHASLFCRDLEEAKAFFTRVIGGELIHDIDGFAEVRVAGIILGLTNRPGHPTGRDAEFPHYAFFIEPENFLPMVAWLHQNGVRTSEPWTRDGIKGLLYFRDPAGNLFEMYCPKLKEAASFVRGAKQGGSYSIDFADLHYVWNP